MVDRGIGRDGYSVHNLDGSQIGVVTSGSPAPFLKTNIAMALVPAAVAASGADVVVQCRANSVRAKQVPIPFYKEAEKVELRVSSQFLVTVLSSVLEREARTLNCKLAYPPWPSHFSTPRNAPNGPTAPRYWCAMIREIWCRWVISCAAHVARNSKA